MRTATYIKKLSGWTGDARLYQLNKPIIVKPQFDGDFAGNIDYIIVSATTVPSSGAETYIFPADEDGEVLNWGELGGSFRGELNHRTALLNAGYTLHEGKE